MTSRVLIGTITAAALAHVPPTTKKRIATWQDLCDMIAILSPYVASSMTEIATVSGSSRDLCVALDTVWVQVTWFSQWAWSRMAVPVFVYASHPPHVDPFSVV